MMDDSETKHDIIKHDQSY